MEDRITYARKDNAKTFFWSGNDRPKGCLESGADICLIMPGASPYEKSKVIDKGGGVGEWSDGSTEQDKMEKLVSEATKATTDHIQSEVDKYNNANGVVFVSVHSCANYINNQTYTHYPFCFAVWNWNVDVWEEARAIQAKIAIGEIPIPETPEEFVAMLPKFEWVP